LSDRKENETSYLQRVSYVCRKHGILHQETTQTEAPGTYKKTSWDPRVSMSLRMDGKEIHATPGFCFYCISEKMSEMFDPVEIQTETLTMSPTPAERSLGELESRGNSKKKSSDEEEGDEEDADGAMHIGNNKDWLPS